MSLRKVINSPFVGGAPGLRVGGGVIPCWVVSKINRFGGNSSVDMKTLQHMFCLVLLQAWIDDALEYCMHSI